MGERLHKVDIYSYESWFPRTKLHPPATSGDLLERPQLLQAVYQALHVAGLVLVSAPAGSGKTTLLANLPRAYPDLPLSWLSLHEEDNEPIAFLHLLIAALQQLHPECGTTALSVLGSRRDPTIPMQQVMAMLSNDVLEFLPEPCVLVLDDLHVLTEPVIFQELDYLLAHRPPQLHLVLSTRQDPPLALSLLRSRGDLVEFRMPELFFDLREVCSLFNEKWRLHLSAADLAALHERTEGWPASLRLVGTSLQHVPPFADRTTFLARMGQGGRHIFAFLAEQVLDRQEPEVRTFLLQTSILKELNAPLCDAVTGRRDSAILLAEFYRRNLFIAATAGARPPRPGDAAEPTPESTAGHLAPARGLQPPLAYRYHALFAEFLHQQLECEMPEQVGILHERAARAEKVPTRAIDHYLEAALPGAAADIIEQLGELLIQRGYLKRLQRWIELLPPEVVAARPRLALLRGMCALHRRRLIEARSYLEEALEGFDTQGVVGESGRTLAYLADLAFLRGDPHDTYALLDRALEHPTPPALLVRVLAERSRMAYYLSAFDQAEHDLDAAWVASSSSGEAGSSYALLECYTPVAAATPAGMERLELLCQRVSAAPELDASASLQVALGIQRATCYLYRGNLVRARQVAEETRSLVVHLGGCPAWEYWALNICALNSHLALSEHMEVDVLLAELLTQLEELSHPPMNEFLYWLAHACLFRGSTPQAQRIWRMLQGQEIPPGNIIICLLQQMLLAQIQMFQGDLDVAQRSLQRALELEQALPFFNIFGSVRVLLANLHLHMGGVEAAALEIGEALSECATQDVPGRILLHSRLAVPPLRLAVQRGLHAELAQQLLDMLGSDGSCPIEPLDVPETGQRLSVREIEVLQMIASGFSNQEIADALFLSIHTIKRHVANILTKLDARRRAHAVERARALGLTR
jgi:LuxR family transcriptional regulator, maltose regulon positive regulatory protein